MPNPSLLAALARSFLAGDPIAEDIAARVGTTLGRPWRWLRPLARRYVAAFDGRTRPTERDVVQFLLGDPGFERAYARHFKKLSVAQWLTEPQQMQPVAAAAAWDIPVIETAGDLAEWLSLEPGELDWFADLKRLGYRGKIATLGHYHYRILSKSSGNIRLIEAPKPRLKSLQKQILSRILEKVPVHPAAHGFIKGRSIQTFVAPHVNQRVVVRMDLHDFFPSIGAARIQAFFRTVGYPESVANLLAGICTNAAPRHIWDVPPLEIDSRLLWEAKALYARGHLPQGAPTSPALANLCAYRVDCRLTGLAEAAGATYTRYADDLAFSGVEKFERRAERFSIHVAAILAEEGFSVYHRKTRIMCRGVRQYLAGLVANQRINVPRSDFDRLKAILTNCVRLGADTQNRADHPAFRSHLEGRVAFVESIHPEKGKRLRGILERIEWT